jgi:hypothetical protein
VRGQLAATREELASARLACQEREAAIAAQQRCDAALAGHAAALNSALAAAAADVALLFERWDEKNDMEDANLELVQVGACMGEEKSPKRFGTCRQAGRCAGSVGFPAGVERWVMGAVGDEGLMLSARAAAAGAACRRHGALGGHGGGGVCCGAGAGAAI